MLSAAFDRLHRARTVGLPSRGRRCRRSTSTRCSAPEAMARAEAEANRIVWEDRPVSIRFATPEEAAALPLRKEPTRSGPLRLIEVEDFDLSACGGTHVARTGAGGRHRGPLVGEVPRRHAPRVRLRRPRASRVPRRCATRWRAACGSSRWRPQDLPSAIEGAQAREQGPATHDPGPARAPRGPRGRRAGSARPAGRPGPRRRRRARRMGSGRAEGAGRRGGRAARRRRGAAFGRRSGARRRRARRRRRPRRVGACSRRSCSGSAAKAAAKPDLAQGGGLSRSAGPR